MRALCTLHALWLPACVPPSHEGRPERDPQTKSPPPPAGRCLSGLGTLGRTASSRSRWVPPPVCSAGCLQWWQAFRGGCAASRAHKLLLLPQSRSRAVPPAAWRRDGSCKGGGGGGGGGQAACRGLPWSCPSQCFKWCCHRPVPLCRAALPRS